MRNLRPADKRFYPLLGTIGAALLLWAVGSWAIGMMPKPLGSELDYIGKTNYGCWFPFCDSTPASNYYYATDMTPDEITGHFTKASPDNLDTIQNNTTTPITFLLKTSKIDDIIYINYYPNGAKQAHDEGFDQPSKSHLISINSEDYQAAKDSL